ncbi:MAG TPA: DUF892 family protein [Candidatus Thermoplasmatota archaeon]|nr:DUF892 family protein [Candidatus Thermoplasmatota archaeon]
MAEKISSPAELFAHELKDIYDAEHKLVEALGTLAKETKDREAKEAFESHREETQNQIGRLDQIFEMIGKEPSRGEGCEGIDGLLEEKRSFGRKNPAPPVLEMFNLSAAAKTERYEITAYESLIRLARNLGHEEAVDLLEETLEEEETALETVNGLAERRPAEAAESKTTRTS